MQPVEHITAFQYGVVVHEGIMDAIHGGGQYINEIFIPIHKIIINEKGGLFKSEKARNVQSVRFGGPEVESPLTEIKLPLSLVQKIAFVAETKLELKKKEDEVAEELQAIWDRAKPAQPVGMAHRKRLPPPIQEI